MNEGRLVSARLLVFRVGTLACAAEVDQVREILPRLPTTRIPGAPPVVAGLVNIRGTLVTVDRMSGVVRVWDVTALRAQLNEFGLGW